MADIRVALAAALQTMPGIGQVSPYMLASPTPPSAHVYPGSTTYDAAFQRGLDEWRFTIQVFVALTTDVGSQQTLDVMLAPGSGVKKVVEADKTLGGACADLRVESCSGYRQYVFDGRGPLIGAEWTVVIRASGI